MDKGVTDMKVYMVYNERGDIACLDEAKAFKSKEKAEAEFSRRLAEVIREAEEDDATFHEDAETIKRAKKKHYYFDGSFQAVGIMPVEVVDIEDE